MGRKLPLNVAILAALSVSSAHVFADPKNDDLEVIEVYAQKRAQPADDVGIAISVVSSEDIENRNIKDTTDIARFSANVKMSKNAAEGTPPAINIRGVGLLDYNTANTSPVAVYIDGVASGSANHQVANFYDIEQVEILKGPQGTLFGRNSTGGAILIRSKKPQFEDSGTLSASLGSDQWRGLEFIGNKQLSDEQALRFALKHQKYDYTTHNINDAYPEAGMEQNDLRVSYLGYFDSLQWYVKGQYSHWNGLSQPVGNIGVINPLTGGMCTPSQVNAGDCTDAFGFKAQSDDFWAVEVNNNNEHDTESFNFNSTLEWELSSFSSLIWVLGAADLKRQHGFNCDGSPSRLCEGNLGLDTQSWSNEFRWQYETQSMFTTLGVYQFSERIEQLNYNDLLRDFRGILPASVTAQFFYDNEIDTDALALFAHSQWQINDQWALLGGLRFGDEEFDYTTRSTLNVPIPQAPNESVNLPYYDLSGVESDTSVSTSVGVNYTPNDETLIYYRYADGYKSGGYNGGFLTSEEQARNASYGPEQLKAHEIGAKVTLPELNLNLEAAVFHYQYDDQQVFMNQPAEDPQQPPLQLLENVASSEISGAEFTLDLRPSDAWHAQLGVGYIPNAEFDEYTDPLGNTLTDNRLPFTSKWNVSGSLSYLVNMEQSRFQAGIAFDYQSDYYFDQNQNPIAKQSDYTLWDTYVVYDRGPWQTRAWANNVFDTQYSNLKFDLTQFLGMLEDFKGEGRRFGVDVTYSF
ncbi:TonB-dependent receptor [Pseudoalteromonas sp. YIC-656]|uniref:TonB-dependent receptor n=1 Tax=Pseudoalteromonas pernae TaxID=3118054 RepID=UPI003241ED21